MWFLLATEFPKILITTVLLITTAALSEVSLSSNSLSSSGPSRKLLIPHFLRLQKLSHIAQSLPVQNW
jgi:hypothetical protein